MASPRSPPAAELHSVTVVLITGERIQATVDVPPGTPVSQVQIPGITGTIKQVIDNGADRHADAEPDAGAARADRPRRAQGRPPPPRRPPRTATRSPARPTGPRAARSPDSSTRAREGQGNQTFRAGNINGKKLVGKLERAARKKARATQPGRAPGGAPTLDNPNYSLAMPGAAPIGVPNFFIDKFRIPPFLLPIYQAAGIEYGVRWEVLAAINEIETDYGRNLNVSSAGALGWMQFMPATWKQYGVDANKDELEGPVQPRRRDLRRRALPQGGRRRAGPAQGDLRLQPRRLVRRLRPHARPHDRRPARPTSSARSPG